MTQGNAHDFTSHITEFAGIRVFFVLAAPPEYGPRLRALINPLITGVGPIEATSGLAIALADLRSKQKLPDLVAAIGSAGSHSLPQGEIFQVSSVRYRDMDASPLGFERGHTPFLDQPAILPLPLRLPDLPAASLSSGADVVTGAVAYARQGADMVDMESFGYFRVCQNFALPMIGLRGISDGAEDLRHYNDWAGALEDIDRRLAAVIEKFSETLPIALGQTAGVLTASFDHR